MAHWKYAGIIVLALGFAGCKSQEDKVQTWEKPETKTTTAAPAGQPGQQPQANNMSEGINSNPNIPDAAKKALGTK